MGLKVMPIRLNMLFQAASHKSRQSAGGAVIPPIGAGFTEFFSALSWLPLTHLSGATARLLSKIRQEEFYETNSSFSRDGFDYRNDDGSYARNRAGGNAEHMKDKSFFNRMRILIAAGSVAGFVGGWALFAQDNQATVTDPAAVVQVVSTPAPTAVSAPAGSTAAAEPTATITVVPTATVTTQQQTTTRQTTNQTRLRTGGS